MSSNQLTCVYIPDTIHNVSISTSVACRTKSLQTRLEPAENVVETINKKILNAEEGRLFAVVHLCGKQFKITAGDIILVEGYWPPTTGDRIRLDKVRYLIITSYFYVS